MGDAEVERSLTFLKTGQYSDVTVCVKNDTGTENTRVFKCHKIILATKSAEFDRLVDVHDTVNLLGTNPDIVQNLLHYIYTDSIKMMATTQVVEQIRVANNLKLPKFESTLLSDIHYGYEYGLYSLEFSRVVKEKQAEKAFAEFICKDTRKVLMFNYIENVAPETIMWLLDQDDLNLNSDYLLLDFLARYRDEAKPTDAFIQEAKKKIRFLNISKNLLIELNKRVKILNECEMFFIKKNLDDNSYKYGMPTGFSTNRQKRSNPQKKRKASASTSKSPSEDEPFTSTSDSSQKKKAFASTSMNTRKETKTLKSPRKKGAFSKSPQKKGKASASTLKTPLKDERSTSTSDSSQKKEAFASTSKSPRKKNRVSTLNLRSPQTTGKASTSTSTIFSEDEPFSSTSESQQEKEPSTPTSESSDEVEEPSTPTSAELSKAVMSKLLRLFKKVEPFGFDSESSQEEEESSTSTSNSDDDDN